MEHVFIECKCEKHVFLTLLECKSITDRVATLPGNLKNLEFNNLEKKNLELENFKKPRIFNIFYMFSRKTSIYYLLRTLKTICVKQI